MKKRFEEDDELDKLLEDDGSLEDEDLDRFLDDEEFKKFLEEECEKEADAVLHALFPDGKVEEYQSSDEEVKASYEKLVARLKADGVYREDDADDPAEAAENSADSGMRMEAAAEFMPDLDRISAAQNTAPDPIPEKVISMPAEPTAGDKKHRKKSRAVLGAFRKAAKYAVACIICILVVSVSGEAGREHIVRSFHYLTGDDSWVVTGNDESNEDINMDEQEAIKDIEEQLEVDVPEFYYRPYGLCFIDYKVDKYVEIAWLEYNYKENVLIFIIDKEDNSSASKIDSLHGIKADTMRISDENINAKVKTVKEQGGKISNSSALWKRDGITYHLSGKMEYEEFIKILQEITY